MTRKHIKTAAEITAQISIGIVIGNVIKATMPIAPSVINRVGCTLGGFFLSTLVAQPIKKSTDDLIDSFADAFKEDKVKVTVL